MATITRTIHRWGGWGRTALTQLSLWTLCAVVLIMVVDVGGRKFFNRPLLGGVELVEQLLLVSVYSSIPLVSLARGHINIEIFDALVPKALAPLRQTACDLFCGLLMIGCAWLVGQHALETRANGDTTTLLRITLWPLECLVAFMLLSDGLSHLVMAASGAEGEPQ